jgi:hypothetical protein
LLYVGDREQECLLLPLKAFCQTNGALTVHGMSICM